MRPPLPAVLACTLAAGCGGGPNAPISAPSYSPGTAAEAAVKQYDKNGNGKIDGAEFDACPGLRALLATADANNDKGLTKDEIFNRFNAYQSFGAGATGVAGTVTLNGTAVEGATVTFVPEECMAERIKGGTATTRAGGDFSVAGDGGLPGLASGVYRVTVSKKDAGGKETLPVRYAAAGTTPFGVEVFAGGRGGSPTFALNMTFK